MPEQHLESVITATEFAEILGKQSEPLLRLANSLLARPDKPWSPKHYFQLIHQTTELESFLDDYGAKHNRDYYFIRELVASLRAFGQTGHSIRHMQGRLSSYGILESVGESALNSLQDSTTLVLDFTRRTIVTLLAAFREEGGRLGLSITPEEIPEGDLVSLAIREKLPRDIDVEDIEEEELKIAEVASKFLLASQVLQGLELRPISDPSQRAKFLARVCTEEQARVYEATVHNLQSAYDTHIKNTVLESENPSLSALRGLTSAALHLLEGATFLTHFYERHESEVRVELSRKGIVDLVCRDSVQELILSRLLVSASGALFAGRELAEDLLSKFTNAQILEVELGDELLLHARPAALIVGIVNHYGTPVSMEVAEQACNAASILELLLAVGSNPDQKRFVFRGDANPLRDIGILFSHGLGENGIDLLPDELAYLRTK
ncbi:MAG: phosphotransferase system HPr-like phosphotransfer protein [Planctomycetota bacterium]|jgi:phosphotransferase system HPr-like phosphotransfer protein